MISYEEYHPYGSTAWWAAKSGTDVSQKRYRYTGKEKDEETGLYYHGARYYAPWLGRWCSADPIGLGDGGNRFAYVHGRPVVGFDDTGTTTGLLLPVVLSKPAAAPTPPPRDTGIPDSVHAGFKPLMCTPQDPSGGDAQRQRDILLGKPELPVQRLGSLNPAIDSGPDRIVPTLSATPDDFVPTEPLPPAPPEHFDPLAPVEHRTVFGTQAHVPGIEGSNALEGASALPFQSFIAEMAPRVVAAKLAPKLGKGLRAGAGAMAEASEGAVTNPVPQRLALVVPAEFANTSRLGAPNATEAWVTAADDLSGIATSEQLARRLALVDEAGDIIPGARAVIEFDRPLSGLASPIGRSTPGFVEGGLTAGGAREFVLPNHAVSDLQNVVIRIVK